MRTSIATIVSACALGAASLVPSVAHAIGHEPYVSVGGGHYGGITHVVVGLGPGLGYRLHVNDAIALYAETRWLWYGGNAFTASLGGMYSFHLRAWAPAIGLLATLAFGQQLRVIDAANPDIPSPVSPSVQARIAPLRFRTERFTLSVLVIDAGMGLEAGKPSTAIAFSIVDIGVRF